MRVLLFVVFVSCHVIIHDTAFNHVRIYPHI
nr:MAG TPA: hypothetical protein [Caudoviricetes sp.]DAP29229.1 MAG TPA: hypothetical protein [Bacteriophage sp.]